MSNQINAMHNAPQFTFGLPSAGGNIQFDVLDGGTHDYTYSAIGSRMKGGIFQ